VRTYLTHLLLKFDHPHNPGLYKLHRFFYYVFGAIAALFLVLFPIAICIMVLKYIGAVALAPQLEEMYWALGVLLVALLHRYSAIGAATGESAGRILSFIIGTVWLLGFPIFTALGIYVLFKAIADWKGAATPSAASER
jgi:hypothetical protein